jgi:hypothetical protein
MTLLSPCHELSALVWDLRQHLEVLVYRLEVQQLLLAASRTTHVARAIADVEETTALIASLETDLARAAAASAKLHDVEPLTTLESLAEVCDQEHGFSLKDHRTALVTLGSQVEELVRSNKDLARKVMQAREVISTLAPQADTYSATGAPAQTTRPALKLNRTV